MLKKQNLTLAIAATHTAMMPMAASADQITLTTLDGSAKIQGQYIGVRGDAYVIHAGDRELVVPSAQAICEGPDCSVAKQALSAANPKG